MRQARCNGEFHRFLQIAMGSASELEYHLLFSRDLKFLNTELHASLNSRVEEVKRMLSSIIRMVDEEVSSRAEMLSVDC
jgi:four helix bundle protein